MKVFRTNIYFKNGFFKKEKMIFKNFNKSCQNFSLIKLASNDNRNVFKYSDNNVNYEGVLEKRELFDFLKENDSTVISIAVSIIF